MSIWYIDPQNGRADADGLREETAVPSWHALPIRPGDTVLIRRGSFMREALLSPDGEKGAPITWSAYGSGENPVFCGSIALDGEENWLEEEKGLWRLAKPLDDEVCNLIFDGGAQYGTLRWTKEELSEPGDWYFTHYGCGGVIREGESACLFVRAPRNPALCWKSIEAALFGARKMACAEHDVVFDGLTFRNSGVHGFATMNCERITLSNCRFENIGGCVWSLKLRIRFGNGVEFWNSARDCRVENCVFRQIYDSCVTHQGGGSYPVPERLRFSGNSFQYYGMAAYEIRDVVPLDTEFSGNRCLDAGMGFAIQGETRPRRSEIWPQPMGHHLFVWRITAPTPGGEIRVTDNFFGSVPYGSAEYSIIAPEAEDQLVFSRNVCALEHPSEAVFRRGRYAPPECLDTVPGQSGQNRAIRQASRGDIDRIADIYRRVHDEEEAGRAVIGWDRAIYPTRRTAEDGVARGDLFVEEERGVILASGVINRSQAKEYALCRWQYDAPDDEIMVLHTLAVDPAFTGRGCGAAFVKFYEEHALANGCRVLRMDTQEKNSAARAFYKKLGFREAGVVDCAFNGIPGVRLVCLEKKL